MDTFAFESLRTAGLPVKYGSNLPVAPDEGDGVRFKFVGDGECGDDFCRGDFIVEEFLGLRRFGSEGIRQECGLSGDSFECSDIRLFGEELQKKKHVIIITKIHIISPILECLNYHIPFRG